MSDSTDFSDRQLEIIGQYVKRNLRSWIQETGADELHGGTRADPELFERAVAVEKELKAQRELMQQGFDQMEKRFAQVDKRFEEMRSDMNQRFSMMMRFMSIGFVALALLMSVYEFIR